VSTKIEWTEETWNPVAGCTRISEGCEHCYIERTPPFRMAHRRFDGPHIGATTGVMLHPERLRRPLEWRKPRRIFVCSMADLFHDNVPDDYISRVFAMMAIAPQHTYQVLTKRPHRMRALLSSDSFRAYGFWAGVPDHAWPLPNVWLGISTETQKWADIRIPILLDTPAAVRWISAEPLLGPVELRYSYCPSHDFPGGMCTFSCPDRRRLNWVVVGGETGPGSRPMDPAWPRAIRDQCAAASVPFFFKQWGDHVTFDQMNDAAHHAWDLHHGNDQHLPSTYWRMGKKLAGRELDGRTHDEYPASLVSENRS